MVIGSVRMHAAPAQVQNAMIGIAKQRLDRALQALGLVAEGRGIGRISQSAQQRDAGAARHLQRADKAHRRVQADDRADEILPLGDQNRATARPPDRRP